MLFLCTHTKLRSDVNVAVQIICITSNNLYNCNHNCDSNHGTEQHANVFKIVSATVNVNFLGTEFVECNYYHNVKYTKICTQQL